MKNNIKIIIAISIILIISGLIIGKINEEKEKEYKKTIIITTSANIDSLYKDKKNKIPVDNLNIYEIDIAINKITYLSNDDEKIRLLKEMDGLKKYINIRDEINKIYENGILKYPIDKNSINNINIIYESLEKNYKEIFKERLDSINNQQNKIEECIKTVNNLFTDESRNVVKEEVTWDTYNNVRNMVNSSIQENFKIEENNALDKVQNELKRRDIELERKRQEEIKNAWIVLNVPYISQNRTGVLNGCEAASLLMGLQYKGYLKNMDLITYATNMPKSTDPYLGFTYSIFDYAPNNVAHWIAPKPLSDYGRLSSGNNNIVDATGYSLDQLDEEISKGNPIVIYATSKFKDLKEWKEGAPKNIHVMLLTGYNKITGYQIVTDPWTQDDGKHEWNISKNTLESKYNKVGKKAVIIR